jgi:hypothetical protein
MDNQFGNHHTLKNMIFKSFYEYIQERKLKLYIDLIHLMTFFNKLTSSYLFYYVASNIKIQEHSNFFIQIQVLE